MELRKDPKDVLGLLAENYSQITRSGGFILTGSTHSFGSGNSDMLLIRTGAAGQVDILPD